MADAEAYVSILNVYINNLENESFRNREDQQKFGLIESVESAIALMYPSTNFKSGILLCTRIGFS